MNIMLHSFSEKPASEASFSAVAATPEVWLAVKGFRKSIMPANIFVRSVSSSSVSSTVSKATMSDRTYRRGL